MSSAAEHLTPACSSSRRAIAVSRQEADQKAADAAAQKAAVASASANLERLRELAAFKRVVAPFDGIVTQRNTDIGMLIGPGQGAAVRRAMVKAGGCARVW